jgi:hypothetical protein
VTFTPVDGASVSDRRVTTDTGGSARTTFRSTAGGTRTRLAATLAGHSLAADSYVLQYDDNVPGVRSPASPFRGRLNLRTDIDDVFRFGLLAGETLRVDATEVDQRREYVALYLHHGSTSDVTDPYRAPLRENSGFADNPLRLSSTVQRDGTRYLDVYGYGSYRLRWWIVSPGMLHSLTASPSRITPNGDGSADRSRLSWEVARRGRVTLRIRNSSGKVVRAVAFGEQRAGTKTFRWSGRNDDGAVVRGGAYRATVDWRNDGGRRASDTTGITVER